MFSRSGFVACLCSRQQPTSPHTSITQTHTDTNASTKTQAASFEARVVVLDHPNEIRAGYTPLIDCHTAHVACKFNKIIAIVDGKDGKKIEDNPKAIKTGQSAVVEIVPTRVRLCLCVLCVLLYSVVVLLLSVVLWL